MKESIFTDISNDLIPNKELVDIIKTYDLNQLFWIHGLVSGLISGKQKNGDTHVSGQISGKQKNNDTLVQVLYATQSGNSRKIAHQLQSEILKRHLNAEVNDMADYNPIKLSKEKCAIVICSTQGEGEPPLAAEEFYNYIHSPKINSLKDLKYAVLALGDKSYVHYCKVGRDIDQKFLQLGASPLLPINECDVDYQPTVGEWVVQLGDQLEKTLKSVKPVNGNYNAVASPKQAVVAELFTRTKPGIMKVTESINLSGRGSNKKVSHIEVVDETGQICYNPGDSLGIYFQNPPDLAKKILKILRIQDHEIIKTPVGEEISIYEYIRSQAELTQLTRDVLEKYNRLNPQKRLEQALSDTSDLSKLIYGHDFLELIQEFPASINAESLADVVGKMQPRLYSIASSPNYSERELHLTIAELRYEYKNRIRTGVCSSYVANCLEIGQSVKAFVQENESFRLPGNSDDIIMIGPGTGVVPYRAFMQEREYREATGKNWLFFGDQHFTTDFLYQTEWQRWKKKQLLTRIDVAFSRDYKDKFYVQHLMLSQAVDLFDWIEKGAHIYICGDKGRMAKDVIQTLLSIFKTSGSMNDDNAVDYLKELKKSRRYHEDVY